MKAPGSVSILVISDYHAAHHEREFQVSSGEKKLLGGSVRLANLIADERKRALDGNREVLCFNAGDMFLGTEYFLFFDGEVEMKVLNTLKFDALAVGNHDFDQGGLANMKKQKKLAPAMDLMCANVVNEDGTDAFTRFKIFERSNIKIGVVALMGQNAWDVTPKNLKQGLKYLNMFETAERVVKQMKSSESKVDYTICLSHTGINRGDTELAKMGIFDCIFAAHEHFVEIQEWMEVPVESSEHIHSGKTILHPGNCYGSAVQKLELSKSSEGAKVLAKGTTILLDEHFSGVNCSEAAEIEAFLKEYHLQMDDIANERIAICHSNEYSREFIGCNLCPDNHAPLSSLVLDSFFYLFKNTHHPPKVDVCPEKLVAMINFGAIRGTLPEGDVRVRDVLNTFPFNSNPEIIKLKGKEIQKLLERNRHRTSNHISGKLAPGMAVHYKWMIERSSVELLEEEYDQDFFLFSTQYIRENDLHDVLEEDTKIDEKLNHLVVWNAKHLHERFSSRGIRDALIEVVRERKVLK